MSEQAASNASIPRHGHLSTARALLDEVNDATGRLWQLDAPFARGALQGAWRVRDGASAAVLKWHDASSPAPYNPDAPAIVEYLRGAGYPTPAWLAFGVAGDGSHWSLQELVDGASVRELDLASAEMFVELVELARTLALPTGLSWNPYLRDHVFGAHPLQRRLVRAGGNVTRLVEAALNLAGPYEATALVDTEMVHGDLNVSNILARDGRLVAVVDIEAAGRGCAVYDLLSPAVSGVSWGSDARAVDRLVQHGVATYGPGPVAIATACLLIETTAWYQRADADHLQQRAGRHLDWLHGLRQGLQ